MREYLEGRIENIERELKAVCGLYKGQLRGVRGIAEKDLSDEAIETINFRYKMSVMDTHARWVEINCQEVRDTIERIAELQAKLLLLKETLAELDKYEAPGTVTVDDAARKIAGNIRQANRRAADCTRKKDEVVKAHFQGQAEAGCDALRSLGYTDEQIEEMSK